MTIDANTFDLSSALPGDNYPTDSVVVFLDAKLLHRRAALSKAALEASRDHNEEKAAEVLAELEEVNKTAEASKYIVHIKGIPRDTKRAIYTKITEEFPPKVDFLGRQVPDENADEAFTERLWQAQIERIEAPDGKAIVSPSEAEIKLFRAKAPEPSIKAVALAIQALDEETESGYESLVEDTGFLSMP